MRAEAAIRNAFAAPLHCGRVPELREIPVVFPKIGDRVEDLAARNCALIVDHGAGGSGPALKLRTSFEGRLRNQLMHVNIDGGFEKPGVSRVVVLDEGLTRIFADDVRQPIVPCLVDDQFFRPR